MESKDKCRCGVVNLVTIAGLIVVLLAVVLVQKPAQTTVTPVINVIDNTTHTMSYTSGISVSGYSEEEVSPDKAVLSLDVVTENKTAKNAKDLNSEISKQVVAALKKYGIADENIETSGYYLSEQTEWDSESSKNVPSGYKLTHTIKVTVAKSSGASVDVASVGKLIDAAVNAGANGVNSVSYGLTKESEKAIKDKLLVKAIEDGKKRAGDMAAQLGVKLGSLDSVSESNYYSYGSYYYESSSYRDYSTKESYTSISPQKVTVSVSVSMSYKIA